MSDDLIAKVDLLLTAVKKDMKQNKRIIKALKKQLKANQPQEARQLTEAKQPKPEPIKTPEQNKIQIPQPQQVITNTATKPLRPIMMRG